MIPIWARELVFPEGFSQFFESIARGTEAQFGPCKTWREAAGAEQSPKCVGQPPMPSPSCKSWGIPRSRLTAVCSPDTRNDGECFCRPRVRGSPGQEKQDTEKSARVATVLATVEPAAEGV